MRNSQEAKTNTFLLVAERWWNVKKASVTEDYAEDIWRSLERDVFPAIGDISVTEIKAHTLVKAVQPVQARGALETVRRLCQRINEVMIYAQNTGLIDAVPSVNIGKAFEKPQKKNMPSIRPEQLPQLMQTMRTASISMSTRCLFMWQLLTITRPAEAAEARWDEIEWRTVGIPFLQACRTVRSGKYSFRVWWTSQHNCLPGSINCALDKFLMEYLIRNLITFWNNKILWQRSWR